MTTKQKRRAPRLLPTVLLRVLPVAALVLIANWYVTGRSVYSTVQSTLIESLDREAEFGAATIASRLDTLLSAMRAVAGNDLIVNSLIDTASRETSIPTFMQSLRLPVSGGAKITLTDYRGRLIASNTNDIKMSDYFVPKSSFDGTYMRLDRSGATFAVPILYSGRAEGAIVVRCNQFHFQELLALNLPTTVTAILSNGSALYSSNWEVPLEDVLSTDTESSEWITRKINVPGYDTLQIVVAESASKAFAPVADIKNQMLLGVAVALLVFTFCVWFTAYLTTRPLRSFGDEIKTIGDAQDLSRRAKLPGVAEFDRLTETFNAMLERMQAVLVSHEQLDRENKIRERVEKALRKSERQYRDMIDGSGRGIYIYDGGRLLFANQAFADMLDYETPQDALDKCDLEDLFDAEIFTDLNSQIVNCDEVGAMVKRHEICLRPGQANEIWFENVSRAVHWEGRIAVEGSLIDITERKAVEKLKNEFVSIVSHELRTPLTSVTGSLSLIQSGALGALPEKVAPLIKIAQANSERLVSLVNDILDVEKIESGHMEFHLEPTNAVELATRALTENAFYGAKFGVEFELKADCAEAYVSADADRLQQVLANLLSNAAKFSPKGGRVVLKLSAVGNSIRFSVIDRGAGIPASEHENIFEKFRQADSSDTRAKAGTGLGLSICRSMVENHGGRLQVKSEVGSGSIFYFDLARVSAPAQLPSTAASADSSHDAALSTG